MEIERIEKIVRVGIWIAFILLAFLSVYYKFDSCNICKLEYKEQILDGSQFMNVYSEKCLVKEFKDPRLEFYKPVNITFIEP